MPELAPVINITCPIRSGPSAWLFSLAMNSPEPLFWLKSFVSAYSPEG
jgi:hypothetical protein